MRANDEYDEIVAELLRASPAEFAAARDHAARRLREAGDGELARRVAGLRKPSVAVWALNQAAAADPDGLDDLRSAAQQLRAAQRRVLEGDRGAGVEMTAAVQRQRRAVDTVSRRLGMRLSGAGHAASEATLRRVSDALRSASLADEDTWQALVAGRLLAEPQAATFTELDGDVLRRVTADRSDQRAEHQQRRLEAAETEVQRAEEALRTAMEQEETASRRREQAANALDTARAALSEIRKR